MNGDFLRPSAAVRRSVLYGAAVCLGIVAVTGGLSHGATAVQPASRRPAVALGVGAAADMELVILEAGVRSVVTATIACTFTGREGHYDFECQPAAGHFNRGSIERFADEAAAIEAFEGAAEQHPRTCIYGYPAAAGLFALGECPEATPEATETGTPEATPEGTVTVTVEPTTEHASPTPPLPGDIELYGVVYSAGSPPLPLADAVVSVAMCVPRSFIARTAADGTYRLLIPADYANVCTAVTLTVTAHGYEPHGQTVSVAELRQTPNRNFVLTPVPAVVYMPLVAKVAALFAP